MTSQLEKFNLRQLQAYAGLCLWQFCKHFGTKHKSIDELIFHLISILSAVSLPDWEQRGATLAITGRGDELPQSVMEILKAGLLDDFNTLVECCVEVGIVDMYGSPTDQPLKFLEKSIGILEKVNAKLPDLGILEKYQRGSDEWGDPISDAEVNSILEGYGVAVR